MTRRLWERSRPATTTETIGRADFAGVDLLARSPASEIYGNFGDSHTIPSLAHEAGDDVLDDEDSFEPWKPLSPGRGTDWEQGERFQAA